MRYALVALFAPALLVAVAAAPVPTHLMPKAPPFYHPTAVGTKWVYSRFRADETHVITAVEEKKGGAKVVTIETVIAEGKTKPFNKMLVTDREWCYAEETSQPYDPPWCVLKSPIGEGYKWDYAVSRPDLGKISGTKVQATKTERLKTLAGTFDAVRVETSEGGKITSIHWYASGLGLVQIDDPPCLVLKEFVPGKE